MLSGSCSSARESSSHAAGRLPRLASDLALTCTSFGSSFDALARNCMASRSWCICAQHSQRQDHVSSSILRLPLCRYGPPRSASVRERLAGWRERSSARTRPQHGASDAAGAPGVHNSAEYGTVRAITDFSRSLGGVRGGGGGGGGCGGGGLSGGEGSARTLRARLSAKRLSRRFFKLSALPSPCALVLPRRSPSCAHQPPAALSPSCAVPQ